MSSSRLKPWESKNETMRIFADSVAAFEKDIALIENPETRGRMLANLADSVKLAGEIKASELSPQHLRDFVLGSTRQMRLSISIVRFGYSDPNTARLLDRMQNYDMLKEMEETIL